MKNFKWCIYLIVCVLCLLITACGAHSDDTNRDMPETPSSSVSPETSKSAAIYARDELHKAANSGNLEKVKAILVAGVDIDARDSFGGTALHAAMFQNDMEIVQALIDYGFDVNARGSSNGFTPLHDAVWADNLPAVRLLIENGADLSVRNKDDQTPAEKAKAEGKTDLYEYLSETAEQ